ncbi:MAG: antibiotic biosynthesis monooxygenase [Actinophytocola sp.]|uniref:putative quinol monooxygenase n=1 Tax=Actinophytocola sp. TaxID=1872138 RepID=UPI00132BA6E4|nr:antibiotic biosynthesis monooxygenase [Actinophytocola sp.]MPZ85228.1 antibiotic biosynthesis monooxygenase [Actinophytocola sp.]
MYALAVRFELKDEASAAAFDRLVELTGEGIRRIEPGTLAYVTHHVEGESLARVFYELYRDRAAFEEHERQPHTIRFLAEREQYITTVRVEFLTLHTAKGVAEDV